MGPEEIKFIRQTLGLSQRELAKALSVAPFTVARWESENGNRPTGLQLDVLRALFNTARKSQKQDEGAGLAVGALVALGVGALLYSLLNQDDSVPLSKQASPIHRRKKSI